MELPRFVEPQLATLAKKAPDGDEWLHETKFDGYRIEARRDGETVALWSRNANEWTAALPSLAAAVARLPCARAILDGEAAVLMPDGRTRFGALHDVTSARGRGQLVYFAFDLLYLDDEDLTKRPLEERKAALASLLERAGSAAEPIRCSAYVTGGGPAFFERACALRREGIVSKKRGEPYRPGRGRSWLKVKCVREQEMVIVGFTEPEGRRKGLGALLLAVNEAGRLRYAGKVGTGFTDRVAQDLRHDLDRLLTPEAPVDEAPRGLSRAHWVKPERVAQVQFTEWTPDGALRHPSFKGLRTDKAASEVVREEPAESAGHEPEEA